MDAQFGQEDQQNINLFSKLNARLHELESTITVQQVTERTDYVNSLRGSHFSTTCAGEGKSFSAHPT